MIPRNLTNLSQVAKSNSVYIFIRKFNLEFPNKIFYYLVLNIPICWASEKKAKHRQQAAAEKQTADNMLLTFILAAEMRKCLFEAKTFTFSYL